jgi:tripartite-type tricarboxylate transporter receptor subunit TctC
MHMRFKSALCALAVAAVGTSAAAQADFPSRTIEILVGFAAGGPVDTVTRAAAPFLERHLGDGTSIAVINRPGAAGVVAAIATSRAEADGHTLMMLSYPALVTARFGQAEDPYSLSDFEFLGNVTSDPHNFFVAADSPYESLDDLMEAARENPGTINVAAAGVGGAAHLALMVFEAETGLSFNYVPADGGAGTQTQVLGGHVDAGITTLSSLTSYVREGQMRILASFGTQRPAALPDVPTAREQGVDVLWGALRGIAAPGPLPDDIRQRLADAVEATMTDPEFIALAERQGIPLLYLSGEEFRDIVATDERRLNALWEATPWQ